MYKTYHSTCQVRNIAREIIAVYHNTTIPLEDCDSETSLVIGIGVGIFFGLIIIAIIIIYCFCRMKPKRQPDTTTPYYVQSLV